MSCDKNFEFLIDYISSKIICRIMNEQGIGFEDACLQLYNSETFKKLSEIETGLYIESPDYVYSILLDEFRLGSLRSL